MKDIIMLRDNEDSLYIYGALIVDKDQAPEIERKIKAIMDYFYDNVVDDYDGNTYDYVLGVLDSLNIQYELVNKINYVKI